MIKKDGKKIPIALIIRFVALEVSNNDPDLPRKPISYLTVAKITSNEICVTDKLLAIPNANEKARELADLSKDKPCLPGGL